MWAVQHDCLLGIGEVAVLLHEALSKAVDQACGTPISWNAT